jgi:hypothetical protein
VWKDDGTDIDNNTVLKPSFPSSLLQVGRQNSIHVTPTVLWNGLVDNSVSSSFGQKEWAEFLEKNVGKSA